MAQQQEVEAAVQELLLALGEDPSREGLRDTPKRVAKALMFALKGYAETAQEVVGDAVFTERLQDESCEMAEEDGGSWPGTSAGPDGSGLVLVRGIDVFSTAEADLRPMFGRCHVAYLPAGGRIVGLSKCARIAEVFARRMQTPERLANEIADGLAGVTLPHGVVVLLELWTIDQAASRAAPTVVCAARGVFLSEPLWLEEFRSLLELQVSSSLSHQMEALTFEVAAAARAPHCGCRSRPLGGCGLSCARLSPFPPRTPSPGASSAEDGSMESADDAAGQLAAQGALPWGGRGSAADFQLEGEPSASAQPPASGDAVTRVQQAALRMLAAAGRDPHSEEMQASARRYAQAMVAATAGCKQSVHDALRAAEGPAQGSGASGSERGDAANAGAGAGAGTGPASSGAGAGVGDSLGATPPGFPGGWVIERDLQVVSMCEHHLLPFYGRAHVCYLPAQPRLSRRALHGIASVHSQRLQVQERLTRDIALDVQLATGAAGVMVVVEAGHMCMVSRGVEKPGSSTCSTAALGVFAGDQALRTQFLGVLHRARVAAARAKVDVPAAGAVPAAGGVAAASSKSAAQQLAPADAPAVAAALLTVGP